MGNVKQESGTLPELLTVQDLARRYRMESISVKAWVWEGKLPQANRIIGGTRFWTEDIIAAWELAESKRGMKALRKRQGQAAHARTFSPIGKDGAQ
ncbi:MAG: hypothetical protein AB1696_16580 [Planctomycetota bacterium]